MIELGCESRGGFCWWVVGREDLIRDWFMKGGRGIFVVIGDWKGGLYISL